MASTRASRAPFGALAERVNALCGKLDCSKIEMVSIIARLRPQLAAAIVFDMLPKTTGW